MKGMRKTPLLFILRHSTFIHIFSPFDSPNPRSYTARPCFLKDIDMAFKCVVVTPDSQIADDTVTQVILPAHDGEMGILTDRSPLLVKLGVGQLRLDVQGGARKLFFVDGGIAQMVDNKLTILTDEACKPEEIDLESAKAEYAAAEAIKITDTKSAEKRARGLARGTVKQRLAAKR